MSDKPPLLCVRHPGPPALGAPLENVIETMFDAINNLDKRLTKLESTVAELGAWIIITWALLVIGVVLITIS